MFSLLEDVIIFKGIHPNDYMIFLKKIGIIIKYLKFS